nr:FAD-dependent oxidoreductase [Paracoccaceae bacterium]
MAMQFPLPLTRDLVLIGGGHAHALVLRKWAMAPQPGVQLTLLNPAPLAAYTGMLPGLVAGHYQRDEVMIDLVRLCRFAGARLVLGQADGFDRANRLIHLTGDRPALRYDIASLDIGIGAGPGGLPGIGLALPTRPLDRFASGWAAFLARRLQRPRITIIGGGLAGAELALAAAHRLEAQHPQITVVEAARALSGLSSRAAARLRKALQGPGITLREHTRITAILPDGLTL